MTCKQFADSVTDYLDDALAARRKTEFDKHRASCVNCQIYFDQMNQLIRAAPALREAPGTVAVPPRLYELLALETRPPERHSNGLSYKPLFIALTVAVILAGLWLYRGHYPARSALVPTTVDLTDWLQPRGMDEPSHPPIELRRAHLDLTVDLPITAEPGAYQVGVAPQKGKPFLIATGAATLIDHTVAVRVKPDLTKVSSGSYRFAVRPDSSDWAYFPLKIK